MNAEDRMNAWKEYGGDMSWHDFKVHNYAHRLKTARMAVSNGITSLDRVNHILKCNKLVKMDADEVKKIIKEVESETT